MQRIDFHNNHHRGAGAGHGGRRSLNFVDQRFRISFLSKTLNNVEQGERYLANLKDKLHNASLSDDKALYSSSGLLTERSTN